MKKGNRSLRGTRLKNYDNVLRITLKRGPGKQTPVVDFVSLTSAMHYQQDVVTSNQEFSAVDFHNTGKGLILDTNTISSQYKIPVETSNPTYTLIDNTGRPQDVVLYLSSEASEAVRTNITSTLNNSVWAQSKAYSTKTKMGLQKHYQYGGGQVKFPEVDEIQMVNRFTPSLNDKLRYRYHLQMGWPQEYYQTIEGDTLALIASNIGKDLPELETLNSKLSYNNNGTLVAGQSIKLPNDSINSAIRIYWKSTNGEATSKSSTNAVLEGNPNVASDSIMAEVSEASTYGWVNWVSEQKIYDGVVNLNNIASEYKRRHPSSDSEDSVILSYVAVAGDTYRSIAAQFEVYEEDVRRINNVTSPDVQPSAGQKITIPSRITLPSIHPMAVVEDNPYEVNIIYRSVKKKDGKILPTSSLVVRPIEITYTEVLAQDVEMKRGDIANGKDLLMHPRVTQIVSAKSANGTITYNPWQDSLNIGDFKRSDNYIDWSPASSATEPGVGSTYYVTYKHLVPDSITITIDTDYQEEGGVDRIWRSPEVKEFKGICSPGNDFVAELPDFNTWDGLPDSRVEDIQYVIEDNDTWVKTWAEQRDNKWIIVGSLQDRVPKDNWFPTIKTGYYYLGKDEYYLFNEPVVLEPTDKEIPIAQNVEFVEGKFENAAQLQEASQNIIRNSGFEIVSPNKTVYKLTF
jgi:LysM repeat protein